MKWLNRSRLSFEILENRLCPSTIAYWRFEGTPDTPATGTGAIADSSGNGLNGTPFGSPSYRSDAADNFVPQTGISNQSSMDFNGVRQRVSIADNPRLHLTHSLTLEAYINVRSFPTSSDYIMRIVLRGDDRIGLDPYHLDVIDKKLWFTVENGSQAVSVHAALPGINQWIHVAGTLNDANGQMALYVNGKLSGSAVTKVRPLANLDPSANPGLGIGNVQSATYQNYFAGLIDEVRISDEALQPSQFLNSRPSSFHVDASSSVIAGSPFGVTVTVLDSAGSVSTSYVGTISFHSSDVLAVLPANYTLTAADKGTHAFDNGVTLFTPGTETLTVTDLAGTVVGTATIAVTLAPPPADHFLMGAPNTIGVNNPFAVTVTAIDAVGQIAQGYTGIVTLSSSDPSGLLPASYRFTPQDNGTHSFVVNLFTAAAQTLTAQDMFYSSITGSGTINVLPAAASHLAMAAPPTATAGTSFDVTVSALDPYGNLDTTYGGTVILVTSERDPQLAAYTFKPADGGTHRFTMSLITAGTQTISVRDASDTLPAVSASVAVSPAAANRFVLTAPPEAMSGEPFNLLVAALDPYGNLDLNFSGTIHFGSTDADPGVVLPADYTFTSSDAGVHGFAITLVTPGSQVVTATDTASGLNGSVTVLVEGGGGRARKSGSLVSNLLAAPVDEWFALLTESRRSRAIAAVMPPA